MAFDPDGLVEYFFCGPEAYYPGYRVPGNGQLSTARTEILTDTLYRYELVDAHSHPVLLQIYVDINEIGGYFWEQELRILLRAGSMRHPALPRFLDGDSVDTRTCRDNGFDLDGFAFIVTKGGAATLADPEVLAELREQPATAIRHFQLIADALSVLHGLGVVHRNMWSGSIAVDTDPDLTAVNPTSGPALLLSHFEMSSLAANLLRAATVDARTTGARLRGLMLGQNVRSLLFKAKEQLDFLFPDGLADTGTDQFSDVFSLGMIVAEWVLPDLPVENFLAAVDLDDPSESTGTQIREWILRYHAEVRAMIRTSTGLSAPLRNLLLAMLAEHARSRPAVGEVLARLDQGYEIMTGVPVAPDTDYLIAFMPDQARLTMMRDESGRGFLRSDPAEPEGRLELAALLEQDTEGAVLTHAPHGADPYVRGGTQEDKREAQILIRGRRVAWFCKLMRHRTALSGRDLGPPLPEVLLVKYILDRSSSAGASLDRDLRHAGPRRTVPRATAVDYTIDRRELDRLREGRPSWLPLIEATLTTSRGSIDDLMVEQAFDWLLTYQDVEISAREYAYTVVGRDGALAKLRLDTERDDLRRHRSPWRERYYRSGLLRPKFADFFEAMVDSEAGAGVEVLADEGGRPMRGQVLAEAQVEGKDTGETIKVRRGRGEIPETGWLRPAGDRGSDVALRRQREARWDLVRNKILMRQLRDPTPVRGPLRYPKAGENLIGGADKVVQEMLTSQVFFALQGPPGTGKTEVAAQAVHAYLGKEWGARVLVSAQSNAALDNLAERILTQLGALDKYGKAVHTGNVIALRVATRAGTARVSDRLEPFQLEGTAARFLKALDDHVRAKIGDTRLDPTSRALVTRWRDEVLPGCRPELITRLRRGANLVFATCSASTAANVAPGDDAALFDWVLIEEAAKAWPTELAIPLVRGLRWTLIGDHRQLPAHRRREVGQFLADCAVDRDPDVQLHGSRAESYGRVFDLFGSLFVAPDRAAAAGARPNPAASPDGRGRAAGSGRRGRPVRRLDTQFRMNTAISSLVGDVFYPEPEPPEPDTLELGAEAAHAASTGPELGGHGAADLTELAATSAGPASSRRRGWQVDGRPFIAPLQPGMLEFGRADRPHGLRAPEQLAEASVAWLDTAELADCAQERGWANPGEVNVIEQLVDAFDPTPRPKESDEDRDPLMILTPYRRQALLLRQRGALSSYVRTIHAAQGSEAEIVIVSLVRDKTLGPPDRPWLNIGHLTQPELANVMLSRARRLLVLVGSYPHFERCGVPFWQAICWSVAKNGLVLPAGDVVPV